MIFKRREDAENAVSQFHKRTLDGAPMHVEIVETPEPRGGGAGGASRRSSAVPRGRGAVASGSGTNGAGAPSTWRGAVFAWIALVARRALSIIM